MERLNSELLKNVLECVNVELKNGLIRTHLDQTGDLKTFEDMLILLWDIAEITEEELEIINGVIDYQGLTTEDEYLNVLEVVSNTVMEDDMFMDFDGFDLRIISNAEIDNIYEEEIKNIVEDCYDLNLDDIPSFVEFSIDWGATAKNCLVDGYGPTFSGYDGSEEETTNYYYFRTN